jgi:hypothetical protein
MSAHFQPDQKLERYGYYKAEQDFSKSPFTSISSFKENYLTKTGIF